MSLVKKYQEGDCVWITSDLHIGHNKEFIWKARGFNSLDEMNKKIIENIKTFVKENDDFYILGDLALGDLDSAAIYLRQIPGNVHIILGNHDTERRIEFYQSLGWDVQFSTIIRYGKYRFYLSHYPTNTSNPGEDKLSLAMINLYGHVHSKVSWIKENPFAFHVGLDSHNCTICNLNNIISTLRENIKINL